MYSIIILGVVFMTAPTLSDAAQMVRPYAHLSPIARLGERMFVYIPEVGVFSSPY